LNGQQQASVLIAVCAPQIFAFSFTVLPLVYQNIACVHLKIFAFLTPPLFILFLGNICRRNKVALSLGNALSFIAAGEGDYVIFPSYQYVISTMISGGHALLIFTRDIFCFYGCLR
jgi:hypothetical protein